MHIDDNTSVDLGTWEMMMHKKDSKFVKDVAVLLWGLEGLAQRCLDSESANKCIQPGQQPRTELTLEKYETVLGMIHFSTLSLLPLHFDKLKV